jgi:DNA-binding CsgD family transcriptional regulator/DNA-directed RNA polymerase subunit RPC12/RpoP
VRARPQAGRASGERATAREVSVVAAVLTAGSEKAAAHRLGLSPSTVKHHLANPRSKVGATTTAQLVWILGARLPEPERGARTGRVRRDRGLVDLTPQSQAPGSLCQTRSAWLPEECPTRVAAIDSDFRGVHIRPRNRRRRAAPAGLESIGGILAFPEGRTSVAGKPRWQRATASTLALKGDDHTGRGGRGVVSSYGPTEVGKNRCPNCGHYTAKHALGGASCLGNLLFLVALAIGLGGFSALGTSPIGALVLWIAAVALAVFSFRMAKRSGYECQNCGYHWSSRSAAPPTGAGSGGTVPPGTSESLAQHPVAANDSKVCPQCAETVKAAALVCRYCGHQFGATS